MNKPRILSFMWDSHKVIVDRISGSLDLEIISLSPDFVNSRQLSVNDIMDEIKASDASIIFIQSTDFCSQLLEELEPVKESLKLIILDLYPENWSKSTVGMDIIADVHKYITMGGDENYRRLFDYISKRVVGTIGDPLPPYEMPWQSIVGFRDGRLFDDPNEYIDAYKLDRSRPFVGIISSRPLYLLDQFSVEMEMAEIMAGYGLNPVIMFTLFKRQAENPSLLSIDDGIRKYFFIDGKPFISAIVKLAMSPIETEDSGKGLLRSMDIPLYEPVTLSRMSVQEWRESDGLTTDIQWKIVLPEFEGFIEPILIGSEMDWSPGKGKKRVLIEERCRKAVRRMKKNIELRTKPNSEKKVLLLLNNFPCHGAEANIGNAGNLDALESTARILKRMSSDGYDVVVPENGKALLDMILEKKAISEFRWTSVEEIRKCGGALYEMDTEEYSSYLSTLPGGIPEDICRTWGEPPGEGMILDGKLLVTGVRLGNAIVALEPKRGCYGPKCDGKVCRILQDPVCAPTHQFMAEFHYFNDIWGADVMIHVGSHGCLEFLPGKSTGLSEKCYPDICVGDTPHIYIYTSNNPTEGIVAKRRSYATIISHMQNPMKDVTLYGGFAELDSLLSEYESSEGDASRSEELRKKLIRQYLEIDISNNRINDDSSLKDCIRASHELLSRIRNTQVIPGLHIFGDVPEGDERADMIASILRFCKDDGSLTDLIGDSLGFDMKIVSAMDSWETVDGRTADSIIADVRSRARTFIKYILDGKDTGCALTEIGIDADRSADFKGYADLIAEISKRIESSDEMGSLMRCMSGRYVSPSPSGYISRGNYEVLPTGRNFYSMRPDSVPFKSAWETGCRLGKGILEKYLEDTGKLPETIGFTWNMSDVSACGGETMSQMMYLLGVEPVWESDGRVKRFRIIPLEELGRPRIDVTVNGSNLMLGNMPEPADYFSSVMEAVIDQDEPPEYNYPRKHSMESLSEGMDDEEARTRIFANGPGCGNGGLYLAILASAWKDDKDLVDYYLSFKGYGYGGNRKGRPMLRQFARMLSLNDITFDKLHTNEIDILSSGRYSSVGGMTIAARYLSGKDVRTYFGDTSDPHKTAVRTFNEEVQRVADTKVFNPEWIEAAKKNGYAGAEEMVKRITRLYGWQSTTKDISGRYFDKITETYVRDESVYNFLRENNLYSAEELVRRLMEAQSRGLWDASEEDLKLLKDRFLELESDLEEIAGDGDFQGGDVNIYTSESLPDWESKMKEVSEFTKKYKKTE